MRKGRLIMLTAMGILFHLVIRAQQQTILGLDTYFEEAYWRYPNIPKGVLEAAAYSASRMTNLQPADNDANNCTTMPARYGLFALVENGRGYFKNNLLIVCNSSNITPDEFKKDVRLQVLTVAKFLSREASIKRMDARVSAEAFAEVFDKLSEIPDDSTSINKYALSLYKYDIYDHLQKGFFSPSLKRAPADIQMDQIFPAPLLRKLKAPDIEIMYDKDSVLPGNNGPADAANISTNNARLTGVGSVNDVYDVAAADYSSAIYVQANANNYQKGRNGTKITNVAIHTTQGSYAGTISWFKNPGAIVSAHYVVRSSDGQITQMVKEADMAYHARSANSYSIGIEHEGFVDQGTKWYTDKLYKASAALVRNICNRRSIDETTCFKGPATAGTNFLPVTVRIKGHQHYSGNSHTDPGKYWNWGKYADLLVDKSTPDPDPEPQFVTIPDGVYRVNNAASSKVLNARDCSGNQGTKITQLAWSGKDCQRWRFENAGDGWYKITNQVSGRALDVPACSKDNVQVQLYDSKNNNCQLWRLYAEGSKGEMRLVNRSSGKILEIVSGSAANDAGVQQGTWNNKNFQKWLLAAVSPNAIPNGIYRMRILQSDKVLQPSACNNTAGTAMQQWDWKGLDCQHWEVEATSDGYFRLVQHASRFVLNVDKCSKDKGGPIVQSAGQNTDCYKWAFEKVSDSTYKIMSKSSGKVLDAADNNAGAAVYQWDWNGGKNQQWVFDAIIGEDSLVVAPNPVTSDEVKINYYLNNPSQHATMMLSDTYGRIIIKQRVLLQRGSNRFTMNSSMLKAGVYLVIIHPDSTGVRVVKKILKP